MPHTRLALAAICLAPVLVVFDAESIAVALPAMRRDLGLSDAALQWIVSANLLCFGGFLLVGGRAADRYGRVRVLTAGLVLFSSAALLAGLAPSGPFLLVARALQGLGAALAYPASVSLLTATYAEGPPRTRALAVFGVLISAALVAGVALGGALVQTLGWRALLLSSVPIGVVAVVLARRLFGRRLASVATTATAAPIAAGATGGVTILLYGLTQVRQYSWTDVHTWLPLAVGLVLLAVALLVNRASPRPLVPDHLLSRPTLACAVIAAVCTVGAGYGVLVILSLYLQEVRGYGPLAAGLLLAPLGLAGALAARICPRFAARFGVGLSLVGALALQALGIALMLPLAADAGLALVLVGLTVMGAGHFSANVFFTALGTAGVSDVDQGVAVGVVNSAQQLGAATGLALLVTIAAARTSAVAADTATLTATVAGFRWALAAGALISVLPACILLAVRDRIRTT